MFSSRFLTVWADIFGIGVIFRWWIYTIINIIDTSDLELLLYKYIFIVVIVKCDIFLQDIGKMYHLVKRVKNSLPKMKEILQTHITHQGLEAIKAVKDTAQMVRSVLTP